ncbi:Hint domain-containing protein [Paenibacillus dendritiformis]|uniref:Hint domain-containing protein n=1 Tax=Paenibacillus dendritiformis TaxID=130049 RepID=UPI001F30B007|nr:Hint domain-containing protein [Paenibacillus dendritiformis]
MRFDRQQKRASPAQCQQSCYLPVPPDLTPVYTYNTVVELFKRQAETYRITVKGITITTTEEHPFWVPGQGWIEARHPKAGDLFQNPELYPIDRIEIKNGITTVHNFRVEGVHNYFVTGLEIWTHNYNPHVTEKMKKTQATY